MATPNQIAANRRNAQKSTGPKSEAGKRISSQNALKSGLDAESQFVLGETREEFAQLQSEYYARFTPTTPELRFQVDNLVRNEWMIRRFFRVESQLWEFYTQLAQRGTGVELGEVFATANPVFMRLQRRVTAAEKAYKQAKTELDRLQQSLQAEETTQDSQRLASFPKITPTEEEVGRNMQETGREIEESIAAICLPGPDAR